MSLKDRISIVSVCDDHYAILLTVLIKSIEVNHTTGEKIDYFIVNDRVSESNKVKLINSIDTTIIQLHWLKLSDVIPSTVSLPLDNSYFPLNIYARLFIPSFIPADADRVLYLDVDMLMLEDVSKLWHTDMQGKTVAGVVDKSETVSNEWAGIENYKDLGLNKDTKYFNSGLLLIDPVKWRDAGKTEEILTCIRKNVRYANFPDQYGLNVIFANQWHELDPLWNTPSVFNVKSPYLIHFTGTKPIYKSYSYNPAYKELFHKYVGLTSWKNQPDISELQRLSKRSYTKIKKILRSIYHRN